MRTHVTLPLLDEIARFSLRYCCDDCAHFDVGDAARSARCTHGYPLGERRARVVSVGDELVFCKEFEA